MPPPRTQPLDPGFRPLYHQLHRVGRPGVWRSLIWLMLEDIKRRFRRAALNRALKRIRNERFDGRIRRDLVKRASRMIVIGRSRVVAPKAQLLLNSGRP